MVGGPPYGGIMERLGWILTPVRCQVGPLQAAQICTRDFADASSPMEWLGLSLG